MRKYLYSALAGLALLGAIGISSAQARVSVGVSIGVPFLAPVYVARAPVYYTTPAYYPAPVYYPPPVYAPPVVYSPPVYYPPRVVYSRPYRGYYHRGYWR